MITTHKMKATYMPVGDLVAEYQIEKVDDQLRVYNVDEVCRHPEVFSVFIDRQGEIMRYLNRVEEREKLRPRIRELISRTLYDEDGEEWEI